MMGKFEPVGLDQETLDAPEGSQCAQASGQGHDSTSFLSVVHRYVGLEEGEELPVGSRYQLRAIRSISMPDFG
jgi:hypothetical protein